jgi:hypothetical protein
MNFLLLESKLTEATCLYESSDSGTCREEIILTRETETNQNEKSCFEGKKDRYCQSIRCDSVQCHIHLFPLDRRLKKAYYYKVYATISHFSTTCSFDSRVDAGFKHSHDRKNASDNGHNGGAVIVPSSATFFVGHLDRT